MLRSAAGVPVHAARRQSGVRQGHRRGAGVLVGPGAGHCAHGPRPRRPAAAATARREPAPAAAAHLRARAGRARPARGRHARARAARGAAGGAAAAQARPVAAAARMGRRAGRRVLVVLLPSDDVAAPFSFSRWCRCCWCYYSCCGCCGCCFVGPVYSRRHHEPLSGRSDTEARARTASRRPATRSWRTSSARRWRACSPC